MQQTTNRSIWDELKMSFEILQTAVHLATYFRIYVKHWNTFAHQNRRRHINEIRTRQTLLQHTCAVCTTIYACFAWYDPYPYLSNKFWFEAIHVCPICSPCHAMPSNEFVCSSLESTRRRKEKSMDMKSKIGPNSEIKIFEMIWMSDGLICWLYPFGQSNQRKYLPANQSKIITISKCSFRWFGSNERFCLFWFHRTHIHIVIDVIQMGIYYFPDQSRTRNNKTVIAKLRFYLTSFIFSQHM